MNVTCLLGSGTSYVGGKVRHIGVDRCDTDREEPVRKQKRVNDTAGGGAKRHCDEEEGIIRIHTSELSQSRSSSCRTDGVFSSQSPATDGTLREASVHEVETGDEADQDEHHACWGPSLARHPGETEHAGIDAEESVIRRDRPADGDEHASSKNGGPERKGQCHRTRRPCDHECCDERKSGDRWRREHIHFSPGVTAPTGAEARPEWSVASDAEGGSGERCGPYRTRQNWILNRRDGSFGSISTLGCHRFRMTK